MHQLRRLFSILCLSLSLAAAACWLAIHLPAASKPAPCSLILSDTPIECYFRFFDSPGIYFLRFARCLPPIPGPPLPSPFGQSPARSKAVTAADLAWRKQFGPEHSARLLGFQWRIGPQFQYPMSIGSDSKRGDLLLLVIPWWFLTTLFALPPILLWLPILLRRHNTSASHPLCPTCGYDLRATPNRCPECGNPLISPTGEKT